MSTAVFQSCVTEASLKIATGSHKSSLNSSQATHVNNVALANRLNPRHGNVVRKNVSRICAEERKWSGFVEKDSAGQQNIYSIEPDLYVSNGAFSTNTQGTDGSGGGVIVISGFLAVAAVSGAAAVLFTVGKNQPVVEDVPFDGPPLSYYVQKFSGNSAPASIVDASLAAPALKAASATIDAALESVTSTF